MTPSHIAISIAPDASIEEALHLLNESTSKSTDVHYLSYSEAPPKEENAIEWCIQKNDLEKMVDMELGMLPVRCIAIPKTSPLFQNHYQILTNTYDMSGQLTKFFPTYFVAALFEIQSLLQKANIEGYVVGGITRDLLLYQQKRFELTDVDITVEGDAIALGEFLISHSRNFSLIEAYPEFGTVKIQYRDSLSLDIASTRKEIYAHSGALPEVIERGVPLAEDIIRRDFTVNALAFSINHLGRILDFTNGIEDIDNHLIRVLHPVSFYEDPSRILRALKFAVRFNFQLADETLYLFEHFLQYGALVYKGGGDRIKYELQAFLRASYQEHFNEQVDDHINPTDVRLRWLQFFLEQNCLQLANMELIRKIPQAKIQRLLSIAPKIPIVQTTLTSLINEDMMRNLTFDVYLCFLLGDLPEDEQKSTFHRLGLIRQQRDTITDFTKMCHNNHFQSLREFSSATELHQLFSDYYPASVVAAILYVYAEEGESRFKILLEAYKTFKRKWEHIQLELDGNDLMSLGIPPGKAVGETLKLLLNAKLSGRTADRMAEIKFIQELVAQHHAASPSAMSPEKSTDNMP